MSEPSEAWRCGDCGDWHDDEDDARECCQPAITEGWKCPECGAYHLAEDEARDCCPPPDESSPFQSTRITPQERAANLKLF